MLKPFPYGHPGVIFIFTIVHLGFSTVYISNILLNKIKNLAIVSEIYNIKKIDFYSRIMVPLVYKELAVLGLIIFLSCLSSLSIPLIAGGGKGANLEMYIFEKIFIDQKWTQAIILSIIQGLFLFLISKFIFNHQKLDLKNNSFVSSRYLISRTAAMGLIIYLMTYVLGYLFKTAEVLMSSNLAEIFAADFWIAFRNSIFIFLSLACLFFGFSLYIFYSLYQNKKINALSLFLSPSTVLIGFGLYLLLPANQFSFDFLKINIGISILFFVGLYKIYLLPSVDQIRSQVIQCRIYNVRFYDFLIRIVWPQISSQIIFVISMLYLIAVSEFALMKAAGSQILTVGTLTESYLKSYRMDQAYVLSFFSLISWVIIYYTARYFYVRDQKFRF